MTLTLSIFGCRELPPRGKGLADIPNYPCHKLPSLAVNVNKLVPPFPSSELVTHSDLGVNSFLMVAKYA